MSDKKALDLFELPPSVPHPKLPGVILPRRQQGTIWCKGRTIIEVMGGGEFSGRRNFFFFCSLLVHEFFFRWNPLHEFFFKQILLFSQWNLDSLSIFVPYKLFYTHNRSKDAGHFLIMCGRFFENVLRGGRNPEWTASLCIFVVPALWNFSDKNGVTGLSRRNSRFKSFVRASRSSRIFLFCIVR